MRLYLRIRNAIYYWINKRWPSVPFMISRYSDAVVKHGPDSQQAETVKKLYGNEPRFLRLTPAVDGMYRKYHPDKEIK